MIISKIKNRIRLMRTRILQRITSISAAAQLKGLADSVINPFFVIVMPGSLHILKAFMRYAPDSVKFVLILNGLSKWEKEWLHSHYPGFSEITLAATLKHGRVIDLLIDHFKKPFGMIDSDCFVFNLHLFEEIQFLPENTLLNACFYSNNEQLDLEIPQTYILFFNPTLISLVKKKYHVNSGLYQYNALTKKVRQRVGTLGIGSECLPEPATKLFDTFRIILLLGFTEGYTVNYLRKILPSQIPNSEIYHIGASHFNNNADHLSFFRGSYFWRFCLEQSGDQELIDQYHKIYTPLTAQELLALNPLFASYSSTKSFVEFVERIMNGVSLFLPNPFPDA